jgi:CRP-like cAMP-binding protein
LNNAKSQKVFKQMPFTDQYAALVGHELFNQIAVTEREQLLSLGVERQFNDGQLIFQRGDPGNSMMLVLQGQVRISIVSEEGKELIFNIIQSGECFGEIALLDGQPRSADATAVGKCTLFTLARQDFIPVLERHPQVAIRLMILLCRRLRTVTTFTERLVFENLPARLARLLIKLAETESVPTPAGICITRKLSQKEIGGLVATSRESVNKQLQTWRIEGLLTLERGYITLLKPAVLKRLANTIRD